MREIRTYGLMRGRWSVRFVRRTGVYSTRHADAVSRHKPWTRGATWRGSPQPHPFDYCCSLRTGGMSSPLVAGGRGPGP
jgi:hypothetical protein